MLTTTASTGDSGLPGRVQTPGCDEVAIAFQYTSRLGSRAQRDVTHRESIVCRKLGTSNQDSDHKQKTKPGTSKNKNCNERIPQVLALIG
eukprot:Skav215864  [mRNA]  locus=scaffold1079:59082:62028:+ [translate_table: standard]